MKKLTIKNINQLNNCLGIGATAVLLCLMDLWAWNSEYWMDPQDKNYVQMPSACGEIKNIYNYLDRRGFHTSLYIIQCALYELKSKNYIKLDANVFTLDLYDKFTYVINWKEPIEHRNIIC